MSTIKIFLASSNELKDIRDELNSQIVKKNKIWKDTGIELDLYRWEEETARVFKYGLQEEYNMNIRDADVFVLLAKTKMGKYTHEEFDVAFREYSAANKPFLFTYFQKTETEPEDSLKEFMGKLNSLKHYLTTFNDFNHLWTQFNDELDRLRAAQFRENNFDAGKLDVSYFVNIIQNFNQNITQNFHIYGEKKIPKELTSIPFPSSVFVGREEILSELHKALFTDKRVVVVNGLGGVGKTTLAQHYINNYRNEYRHIAWINLQGSLTETIAANTELQKGLGIDASGKKGEELFYEVTAELRTIGNEPVSLLVIDNAEASQNKNFEKLPHAPGWHLLFTSREKLSDDFSDLKLNVLGIEKAFEMFRSYCPKRLTDDEVKSLLDGIGCHTLMTEILAKHANKFSSSTYDKLRDAIPKSMKTNINTSRDSDTVNDITKFLREIFKTDKLDVQQKKVLMQFTAIPSVPLHPDTLELLLEGVSDELEITLSELSDKGWLQKEGDNDTIHQPILQVSLGVQIEFDSIIGEIYRIHQLIQQVLRIEFSPSEEDLAQLITNIVKLLSIDQSKDDPLYKFQWIQFGDALLEMFPNSENSEISLLQNNLALVNKDLGDYEKARDLLEKALKSDIENFGEKHPSVATSQSNLATVYRELGDYEKARDLLEKALKFDIENFGEKHPSVATCQSNLANVYRDLGDYEKARDLLEKVLKSNIENFGDKHPSVAISQSNLANVYRDLGDYEKARDLLEKALKSDIENFGDKHPSVASSQSNLALAYEALGNYEKARDLLEKVLKSYIENFGDKHPSVAISQSNLANVYRVLGDYEKARDLLEKALKSDIENFGEKHPSVARRQSNLALVYKALGDYEKAGDLLDKALKSDIENFGNKHPSVARCQSNLAAVYINIDKVQEAFKLWESSYYIYKNHLGENHPDTRTVKEWIELYKNKSM